MQIPFVNLTAQYDTIKDEVDEAINQVVRSARFVGGDPLSSFERNFATFCDAKHAVGVANGTDALQLSLRALGIGNGDEVITAANTFIATAAAIATSGAAPVFVDIDPETYTLDPRLIEAAITPRTKAIIPVHLYGQPADMKPILSLARSRGIHVIEDAAQAHGAEYEGRRVGSLADVACFSFYPGKNLGAYGDAGAVVTNNDALAERIARLRDHGRITKYEHAEVGFNSRLDTLQAAVLDVKLRYLDYWNGKRQQVANWYNAELAQSATITPKMRQSGSHVYHLYVIQANNRDELQSRLEAAGVASGIHYPLPLHLQPAFAHLGYATGDFPRTEEIASRLLSLPMFPELTREEVGAVVGVVRSTERVAA